jgi:hypothetical protein
MYRVKAIRNFTDLEENIYRTPKSIYEISKDNTWVVDKKRYDVLKNNYAVVLVEEIQEELTIDILVESAKEAEQHKTKKPRKKKE